MGSLCYHVWLGVQYSISYGRNYEIQSLRMLPTKVRTRKDGLNINLLKIKYLSLLVNSELNKIP